MYSARPSRYWVARSGPGGRADRLEGAVSRPFFFFGSLRDAELLEIVLGRECSDLEILPARAPGYRAQRLADEAYPELVPAEGRFAEGVAVFGMTAADHDRLAYFEEAEYGTAPIAVETENGPLEALHFRATGKARTGSEDWDFARWAKEERRVAHHAARELMSFYGRLPVEEIDTVWTGIMNRARARARAEVAPMPGGALRGALGVGDVEVLGHTQPWAGYFSVEDYRLRHRTYAGDWSPVMSRAVMQAGDAVTVVPYDPKLDAVLLIEQFRVAPFARGDAQPWCIEPVAGRIDGSGTPEDVARREAREEAGLEIGRIERIAEFYTTPGITGEVIVAYCGEADLSGAGGIHGLAEEGEDIRVIVLPFDAAMEAVAAGTVNTAPAILSLLWVARERDRLRQAWG